MRVPKRRKRGEFAVVAAFALLGFLLAVQLKSVKLNTAVDATSASRLETLQSFYNDLALERDGLKSQLDEAQRELEQYRQAAASGEGSAALKAEVDYLTVAAGLTDVEGPGVCVILSDSQAENTTGDEADYLIHDSDLLSVINELRDAGAPAISLTASGSSAPRRSAVRARWSWSTESALPHPLYSTPWGSLPPSITP